jgi:hypothetical protein
MAGNDAAAAGLTGYFSASFKGRQCCLPDWAMDKKPVCSDRFCLFPKFFQESLDKKVNIV